MPGFHFQDQPGRSLHVAGQPARLTVSRSSCGVQADLRMSLVIAVPGRADAWDQLTACIRGPDIPRAQTQIQTLIQTAHFTA